MKNRISSWVFGYEGLMLEYQRGEKWIVVVGTVMMLVGLGLALYWAIAVTMGGDVEWRHLAACLAAGLGGGQITFIALLHAAIRELKKRREDTR